ncbi:MAG TPA: mechanosensitive ion channel family protein [Solirubrobacteraceae bacterium]|nr:mechanosensitive ion channel family protein [Solirubrobacteraceae bacterium]
MVTFVAQVSAERLQRACGDEPGPICTQVLESTGSRQFARIAQWALDAPLRILLILVVAWVVNRLMRRAVKRGLRGLHSGGLRERMGSVRRRTPEAFLETGETSIRVEQRIEALTSVLRSGASFTIWLIAGFMILGTVGVDLGPLLAGAGVLGVALGFGSQSLVKDFLSGLFILVEDQYGVGDIVDLDQQTSGVVEAVSLRTTRLRAVDGTVWHVPNGDILRVGNKSQHWSRALLDVEVAYSSDLEHAKQVMKGAADEMWREDTSILEEPEMWGVQMLNPNGVLLRLTIKTTPNEQFRISRELLQRIKDAFDAEGIEIPFPQQTVWHRAGGAQGNGHGGGEAPALGGPPASGSPRP